MIFQNIKNNQVANVVDNQLIEKYINNKEWIVCDKDILKEFDINIRIENEIIKKQIDVGHIKQRLNKLSEDIIQNCAGEIVPNIEERKKEFIQLHNKLRQLENKEIRPIRDNVN